MASTLLARQLDQAIARFSALQNAVVYPRLMSEVTGPTDAELLAIASHLHDLLRRGYDDPVTQASLRAVDDILNRVVVFHCTMVGSADASQIARFAVEIGEQLAYLSDLLHEVDHLMETKVDDEDGTNDSVVSPFEMHILEVFTREMANQTKELIDSLDEVRRRGFDEKRLPEVRRRITLHLDKVESSVNELIGQGHDHRPAQSILHAVEMIRLRLLIVPEGVRLVGKIHGLIVSSLFGMINDLLSLGQLITEKENEDTEGKYYQCEECLVREIDRAIQNLEVREN
ncbi:hypothetical protein PG993_005190 [Apiospora rasikravindrae]|uniref:Uncharacterized protein n=1 Tax=Apiospora rasikravindrae TaxID=990691 RepID=A0ABR1TEW3_9PEZI